MAETKPMSARQNSELFVLSRDGGNTGLRLQLQKEIDRLALLIEEVKRQSDRVQATADAIADRILLEAPRQYFKARRSGAKGVSSPDSRNSTPKTDGSSVLF